jgi:hypothetical protein
LAKELFQFYTRLVFKEKSQVERGSSVAPDGLKSPRFWVVYVAWSWFRQNSILFHPAHPRATLTVETIEKVPFQKSVFEKRDRNIEKHLVFCVLNNR